MESGVSYLPKFGRVLIKREVKEKVGSIIIPENQAKRHAACEGIIVALGETAGWTEIPGKDYIQTLHVGDRVIFGRHSGAWLDASEKSEKDDGTLFICQDGDILCTIKE